MAITGRKINILKMTAAADELLDATLSVESIRWVGGSTAGHSCIVTDGAGNVLFESVADAANFIDAYPIFKAVNGIIVSTLGSGTVYVYLI